MSDTNNKKSETPVADWILEHVRPHAAWVTDDKDNKDGDVPLKDLGESFGYAMEHIEIGIKFKFKF